MREELAAAYSAAMDQASQELDTWCCPECGFEVKCSGAFHIEWGNPSCRDCLDLRGKNVLLKLGLIERVVPSKSGGA